MDINELINKIDRKNIPKHVAIIMDGNGRWASKRSLPRIEGHRKGVQRVKDIVKISQKLGIEVLTLYAFSTENWFRPKTEIKSLMNLLVIFLRRQRKDLIKNDIKLVYLGDIEKFPKNVVKELKEISELTALNKSVILNLALNYGGRDEIIRAVNNLLVTSRNEKINITEKIFSKYLYTTDLPDPDLLIRTSGERRISNFLLWQIAYTELYFTPVLWPDFKERDFLEAILDYQKRIRRFGGL